MSFFGDSQVTTDSLFASRLTAPFEHGGMLLFYNVRIATGVFECVCKKINFINQHVKRDNVRRITCVSTRHLSEQCYTVMHWLLSLPEISNNFTLWLIRLSPNLFFLTRSGTRVFCVFLLELHKFLWGNICRACGAITNLVYKLCNKSLLNSPRLSVLGCPRRNLAVCVVNSGFASFLSDYNGGF